MQRLLPHDTASGNRRKAHMLCSCCTLLLRMVSESSLNVDRLEKRDSRLTSLEHPVTSTAAARSSCGGVPSAALLLGCCI